jgi:hypothetical protein
MLTQQRASRAGEQAVPTLNLTPMIDVVFQLIIFFMCAMRFKTLEKKIEMSIPKTDGMRPDLTMPPDDPVKVRVSLRQTETEGIPRLLLLGEAMRPELGRGLHRLASLPKDAPEGRREADNARRKQRWERHFQPKLDALEARLEHIASVEPRRALRGGRRTEGAPRLRGGRARHLPEGRHRQGRHPRDAASSVAPRGHACRSDLRPART